MLFERRSASERMDQESPDPAMLSQSLRDLAWANHYFGGTSTILYELDRLLGGYTRPAVRVLDVGVGGGDVLAATARWCAARSLRFEGLGLDRGGVTLEQARARLADRGVAVEWIRGDACALPLSSGAVDVAICGTTLHHLDPDGAVVALREMARASVWGVVVSDLRRTVPGYLAVRLLAATVWRGHEYARHDGPASMRAAYTLREARCLADRAGLSAVVSPRPGFRWSLRWRRR